MEELNGVDLARLEKTRSLLVGILMCLCWIGLVESVAALVYVLMQVPWTTTVDYSHRNGPALLLVLLAFPVIFWMFVRPSKKTMKKKVPRKPERGDICRVIAAMALVAG
ncbi:MULTISPECIES: hypothetical protein [unclassified Pseudoclavibacter]|uniref:hypothetical protein n=1 Tax=unclassified Pseudoclavibacter TaxID=2615177 RepID=UPI0013017CBC|nr:MULTISPECIES: hypothetical protein [unclassified Pseudoclavibacter]KAB1645474.1 hypothetical protein F8O06_07740 [Pseudoclavibacter sp. CFCC 14310]KAB1646067.1 hypothetical protein F8O06_04705 [Pseudoclavibacter sp. CFCC 14310]KAB1663625.1 hypothetical protein F8O08_07840 [Pseudoclavibacter sp. CFCC 13611]